jgi:hypothetical protein
MTIFKEHHAELSNNTIENVIVELQFLSATQNSFDARLNFPCRRDHPRCWIDTNNAA